MENNVVKLFPGQPSAIELFGDESNAEPNESGVDERVGAMVQIMTNKVAGEFLDMGLDPEDSPKEFCFLIETIISYILAQHNQTHVLQEMAKYTIEIEDADNMLFKFVPPKLTNKE